MKTDAGNWIAVAHSLGIEIVAPFNVELSGEQVQFTALFPQFGAPAGMVVDANWDTIQRHQSGLVAAGYGFSCVGIPVSSESIVDMLSDWGWFSHLPKPEWLEAQ